MLLYQKGNLTRVTLTANTTEDSGLVLSVEVTVAVAPSNQATVHQAAFVNKRSHVKVSLEARSPLLSTVSICICKTKKLQNITCCNCKGVSVSLINGIFKINFNIKLSRFQHRRNGNKVSIRLAKTCRLDD